MTNRIVTGDCREVLAGMEPDSVHAVVTDPPYHLTSIVKRFSRAQLENEHFARTNPTRAFRSLSRGFMGQTWDGGDVAMDPATWAAVLRVLKPGGHLIALCGTRTEHRVVCAIEDAGFEIRDRLLWLYGQGFNKGGYISYKLEGTLCERRSDGKNYYRGTDEEMRRRPPFKHPDADHVWGQAGALKPAVEIAVLARKPLSEGSVAANVLAHGTGALNVDACRVSISDGDDGGSWGDGRRPGGFGDIGADSGESRPNGYRHPAGRWPPNVLHDGSPEVMQAFARFGGSTTGNRSERSQDAEVNGTSWLSRNHRSTEYPGDTGTAARFFPALGFGEDELRFLYEPKADRTERAGTTHPTVKPIALMEWLVRLVTPPGGVVLDPFAGSGSTLIAAERLGFDAIGIEQDAKTVAEAEERIRRFRARRAIGRDADRVPVLDGQGRLL